MERTKRIPSSVKSVGELASYTEAAIDELFSIIQSDNSTQTAEILAAVAELNAEQTTAILAFVADTYVAI